MLKRSIGWTPRLNDQRLRERLSSCHAVCKVGQSSRLGAVAYRHATMIDGAHNIASAEARTLTRRRPTARARETVDAGSVQAVPRRAPHQSKRIRVTGPLVVHRRQPGTALRLRRPALRDLLVNQIISELEMACDHPTFVVTAAKLGQRAPDQFMCAAHRLGGCHVGYRPWLLFGPCVRLIPTREAGLARRAREANSEQASRNDFIVAELLPVEYAPFCCAPTLKSKPSSSAAPGNPVSGNTRILEQIAHRKQPKSKWRLPPSLLVFVSLNHFARMRGEAVGRVATYRAALKQQRDANTTTGINNLRVSR